MREWTGQEGMEHLGWESWLRCHMYSTLAGRLQFRYCVQPHMQFPSPKSVQGEKDRKDWMGSDMFSLMAQQKKVQWATKCSSLVGHPTTNCSFNLSSKSVSKQFIPMNRFLLLSQMTSKKSENFNTNMLETKASVRAKVQQGMWKKLKLIFCWQKILVEVLKFQLHL